MRLEFFGLVTPRNHRPASQSLRHIEAGGNTSDVGVQQQLLDESSGVDWLPNIPHPDVLHPDIPLLNVPVPDIPLPVVPLPDVHITDVHLPDVPLNNGHIAESPL